MNAEYTFISYFREGLANELTSIDANTKERVSLEIKVKVNATDIKKDAKLYGPADVIGINPKAIIRVSPLAGSNNMESNYLPFIEFYDEDFPWRYSPAIKDDNKIFPWLALIVLKEDEFTIAKDQTTPLPYINVIGNPTAFEFPAANLWAMAHVQLNSNLTNTAGNSINLNDTIKNEITDKIKANPDIALSRIISPRKLDTSTPNINYTAFLIPSYETGRLAGLGEVTSNTNVLEPSWNAPNHQKKYPFYYQWSFQLDQHGDFEYLAGLLAAGNSSNLKVNTLDIQDLNNEFFVGGGIKPGGGISISGSGSGGLGTIGSKVIKKNSSKPLRTKSNPLLKGDVILTPKKFEPTKILEIGSVLIPPNYSLPVWPGNKSQNKIVRDNLKKRISKGLNNLEHSGSKDPIVNYPEVYGRWHANIKAIGGNSKKWIDQINLDPRYRVVASLGAEVVRQNQEEFVDFAWDQVGEIMEANKQLNLIHLAKNVSARIEEKHLTQREEDDLLTLTSNVHSKIKTTNTNATIHSQIVNSNLTKAGTNTAFKKITRPNGMINKKIKKTSTNNLSSRLIKNLDDTSNPSITAAVPKDAPYNLSLVTNVSYNNDYNNLSENEKETYDTLKNNTPDSPSSSPSINSDTAGPEIRSAIGTKRILKRGLKRLHLPSSDSNTSNSNWETMQIMASPVIPHSMYDYLKKLNPQFILPGLEGIENNTITLLETNGAFIETFMLGANHEFSKELLWREYPCDQKGTYFKNFWNKDDSMIDGADIDISDIKEIQQWGSYLGKHQPSHASTSIKLVLALRGDLFKKFPNTIIYAQKANANNELEANTFEFPVLSASLGKDLTIVGFTLSLDEVLNGNGWFFMFKERSGEVRFGLDEGPNQLPFDNWNKAGWDDFGGNKKYLDIDTNINDITDKPINGIEWGKNSAHMAHILYQVPVAFGIHASDLLAANNQ
ncbi:MAG: hypothetical protein AB8H03_16790 [Saprospiraceae bacterium]